MKFKIFLQSILLLFPFCFATSQETIRPLYNVTIKKDILDQGKWIATRIEIDSSGNVYIKHKKSEHTFDIKRFTNGINDYVVKEDVEKHPGNNDISITEERPPELDKQKISIEITFLDDIKKKKDLRNKTYYSWADKFDKNISEYPFYKYFSEAEVKILKALLH